MARARARALALPAARRQGLEPGHERWPTLLQVLGVANKRLYELRLQTSSASYERDQVRGQGGQAGELNCIWSTAALVYPAQGQPSGCTFRLHPNLHTSCVWIYLKSFVLWRACMGCC